MINMINHGCEPRRLLLVWQAPEGLRARRAVAELQRENGSVRFRYLVGTDDFEKAHSEGFVTFPAFRKLGEEYKLGVLETFSRRLPPRTRADYPQYLRQFRLTPDVVVSDFALLGYTGAKLPSDGFSLIDPLDAVCSDCEVLLEVAGFRHHSAPGAIPPAGSLVNLMVEPNNQHDDNAVAVHFAGKRIGYVPRQQSLGVRRLLETGSISAWVERINGTAERPVIYLMASIRLSGLRSRSAGG